MIPHRPLREDVLSRKLQTQTPVRHHGAGTMAETVREPDVFGLRAGEAELVAEDLHDGGYAAEGEAAVAAEAGDGGPGRADPIKVEPGVEGGV